jgi:hypothetical protein
MNRILRFASRGFRTGGCAIQSTGTANNVRTQNAVLSVIHNLNPNTLNELHLGYNRPKYLSLQDGAYGTNYAPIFGLKNLLTDPIARASRTPACLVSAVSGPRRTRMVKCRTSTSLSTT